MSFKDWILRHKEENSPLGDLATDISNDSNFPDTDSKEAIETYLNDCGASDNALNSFTAAWNYYSHSDMA